MISLRCFQKTEKIDSNTHERLTFEKQCSRFAEIEQFYWPWDTFFSHSYIISTGYNSISLERIQIGKNSIGPPTQLLMQS